MNKTLKVGVLASGSGTDLQSIIDASENNMISAQVVVVISDKKDARCLQRAKKHHILNYYLNPQGEDKQSYDQEISKLFQNHNVELVVGAGYMRLLSKDFVKQWYGKLINIHPALLPSFKGTNGQKDALEYGVKISGCTTHFVDTEMDHGPIILQAAVKVHPNDTRDSLAQRILSVEHQILPRTIQLYAEKRLQIKGRNVIILPGDSWLEKNEKISDVLYSEGY
ncbi:MAG: phosphoribosylglycinamide formyltransferase [Thermoplasmatota archaeon]